MIKALYQDTRAATVAEFATFAALAFTLSLALFIALSDTGKNIYPDGRMNPELLSDRLIENCLTRTRANDTVVPRQAKPYNCFKLAEGNDRITISSGDNIIYPGPGRNVIFAQAGTRETLVVHEGGEDVIHLSGGSSTLDMRKFRRADIKLDIVHKTPSTMKPGARFDPENRPAVDLMIRSPESITIIADHFDNKPLSALVTKDVTLFGDTITQEAISDQVSQQNDRIIGTSFLDLINPGSGNDTVESFSGDDVITYTDGHDRYDPGEGRDILDISGIRSGDVKFSVQPNGSDVKISISKTQSIILIDQLKYPPSGGRMQFATVKFSDAMMREQDILRRAVTDQGTPGDDHILGTAYADTIYPGTGTNLIQPGKGSDLIHHQGGIDTIRRDPEDLLGTDVLVLDDFARSEITFAAGAEQDLVLTTPDGSMIVIEEQLSIPAGEKGTNIEIFRLRGEELSDDIMRKLFFPNGPVTSGD